MERCTTYLPTRWARAIAWLAFPIVLYQTAFLYMVGVSAWWWMMISIPTPLAALVARLQVCDGSVTLRRILPIHLDAQDLVSVCLLESRYRGRAWSSRIEFRTRTGRVYSSWAVRYAGWWPGLGLLSHRPEHVREVAELISEKLGVPCVPWNN